MNPQQTQYVALKGKCTVRCQRLDGSDIDVDVAVVKVSQIDAYLDIALDERKGLEMTLLGFPKEELDTLTDESYTALLEASQSVNFSRAVQMKKAELARTEKMGNGVQGIYTAMGKLLSKYAPQSPSTEDSPESSS